MDFRLKLAILICLFSLLGDVNPVLGKKGGTKQRVKVLEQSLSELKQQMDEQQGKMEEKLKEQDEKMKEQDEKMKEQDEKIKEQEERIKTLEECDACSKIAELNKTLNENGNGKWLEFTPEWCGLDNRRAIQRGGDITEEECKQRCPNCAAIEYWSGPNKHCFECLDHTKRKPFTDTADKGYPPHVFVRQ